MRSTGPLAAITAAALILTLAGCTGTSPDEQKSDSELTPEDSPLSEYLDAAWSGGLSQEDQDKKYAEEQAKVEKIVAQCMTEQGFEYVPVEPSTESTVISDDSEDWKPDSKDWVEKYGYGIVNYPGKDDEVEPEPDPETEPDPNLEYIDSLSESESAAYDEALYGPTPDEVESEENHDYRWEEAGCMGSAEHEVRGDDVFSTGEFDDLFAKIEDLWSAGAQNSAYAELDARWAECMADKGESGFSSPTEAIDSIYSALPAPEDAPSEPADEEEPAETGEPTDKEVPEGPELDALGVREIELALVDLACREKTSYAETSLKIQFDVEEQFIAENKAELDAFKLAAEQAH
jgi:hypothetical protein